MLERQQAGLTSPFARQGRFSYLEPSVAAFATPVPYTKGPYY